MHGCRKETLLLLMQQTKKNYVVSYPRNHYSKKILPKILGPHQQFFVLQTNWQGLASLETIDYKKTKFALSEYWGPKLGQAGAHSFYAP